MKKWLEMQLAFENEQVDVKTRLLLLLHELTNIHIRLTDLEDRVTENGG